MRMSHPGPQGQAHPASWRRWLLPPGGTVAVSPVPLAAGPSGAPA